ncbi:molybdopterin molybdotransferase MoeA [Neisseria elongata]|uniref:molybdopterin molybdotransferase MoeA n=1 Tax=Neisseria elongata TaxID=495 RepID=UPI000AAF9A79|nr:molybdopterin molybdotransferase MoeA [Neisseria elongata]
MALTSVSELQSLIHEHITRTPRLPKVEHIPVAQSIGRVLAEDMVSALNIPATDMSAMDGYALPSAAAAGSRWQIAGEVAAGKPFTGSLPEDGCIRIMTGAVVPPDCTCIVLQEHTETDDNTVVVTNGQVYDSNRHTLMARLAAMPVEFLDLGQAADDLEGVLHTLDEASRLADVVITSGGVSVGDYDYMREAVDRLGAIHHYKVAIKPGKPFVFGQMLKTWYFGLPGNPVSGYVGFDLFLKAALWQLCGAQDIPQPFRLQAVLSQQVKKSPGRMDIQRAVLTQTADGTWEASPASEQDSHRVWGVSRANGYITKQVTYLQALPLLSNHLQRLFYERVNRFF